MSYSELKTPTANFRLLHQLEGRKTPSQDLPKNFDAVLVEMVHQPPIKDLEKRIEVYIRGLESNPDLKSLVKKVKEVRARVWFGDLAESPSLSSLRDLDLMVVEFLAGLYVLSRGVGFLFRKKDKQLKGVPLRVLGLIGAGLWLLSSIVEVLGVFLVRAVGNTAKKGPLKAIRGAIAEASNLHPEKTVVFFRNLVLAEKAWEIVEIEKKKIGKPLVVLDFHFGHAGLLKMIKKKPETRRVLLYLYRPFIKDILRDSVRRDYLARLISVSWDGQNWQLEQNYLVDSLEDLYSTAASENSHPGARTAGAASHRSGTR
jgi:hypothetical protein